MITYVVRVFADGSIAVHTMRDGRETKVTFTSAIQLGNVTIESRNYPLR